MRGASRPNKVWIIPYSKPFWMSIGIPDENQFVDRHGLETGKGIELSLSKNTAIVDRTGGRILTIV